MSILSSGFDVEPPTATLVARPYFASGGMTIGAYRYKVTFATRFGETTAGPASLSASVQVGSMLLTGLPISTESNVTARKIYRTEVGNTLPYRLVSTIADNVTTTYVDMTADADLGAEEPAGNFASSFESEIGWVINRHPIVHSIEINLEAGGSGQSDATPILQTSEYIFVTGGAGGVKLPPVETRTIGASITIKNESGLSIFAYPNDPLANVDGGSALTIANGVSVELVTTSTGTWRSIATSGGSGGGGGGGPTADPLSTDVTNISYTYTRAIAPSAPYTIVTIRTIGATAAMHQLVYVQRGSAKYYSDQTPQLAAPAYDTGSPMTSVTFGIELDRGDVIVYALYSGANTVTAGLLTKNSKKLNRVSFVRNTVKVVYSAPNYVLTFRPLADYGYTDVTITSGADAIPWVSANISPDLVFESVSGSFVSLVEQGCDISSFFDIIVFKFDSFVVSYGISRVMNTQKVNPYNLDGSVNYVDLSDVVNSSPCDIYWGDGTITGFGGPDITYKYAKYGGYYVEISGHTAPLGNNTGLRYQPNGLRSNISGIVQWGGNRIVNNIISDGGAGSFVSVSATDAPAFDGTVMSGMFESNEALKYVNMSAWDFTGITDMSNVFAGCLELAQIVLPTVMNTSSVTTFNGMFSDCRKLQLLNVSGLNTSSATDLNQMFLSCERLMSINVSGFDVTNVTSAFSMFKYCTNLRTINISGWNAPVLTNIDSMFQECSSLKTFNCAGITLGSLTNMNFTFAFCKSLTTLDLSSMNVSTVQYMQSTCEQCVSLTNLIITGWTSSVLLTASAFISATILSSASYDDVLNTFSAIADSSSLNNAQWDIPTTNYTIAGGGVAHTNLVTNHSWNLNDAGGI